MASLRSKNDVLLVDASFVERNLLGSLEYIFERSSQNAD